MLPYIIFALVIILPVDGSSGSMGEDQAQAYRKRIHPPLVRMIRSLEDELQSLPRDNSQSTFPDEGDQEFPPVTESSDIHFDRNVEDFSKPANTFLPTSIVGDSNDPAATEYQPASTPTPQFPDMERTVSPSLASVPIQSASPRFVKNEEKSAQAGNVVEEDDEEDSSDENAGDDEDDDDDDDDNDDNDIDDDEEEQQNSKSSTQAPAYFKDVYFLAKEEKHDKKLNDGTSDAAAEVSKQDSSPATEENGKRDDHPASNTEAEKQNGPITAVDKSDLSPEQDIDETLTEFEQQHRKKSEMKQSDSNTNLGNNNNNNLNVKNIGINNNTTLDTKLTRDEVRNEYVPHSTSRETAPVADQYNYNAANGDTSLEIDISADDENQESSEIDESRRNADGTENYEGAGDSGNTSAPASWVSERIVTPTESDKTRLEEEIMERLNSEGMEKRLVKKSMMRHSHANNKLRQGREEDDNEDILQLMIRVAEDPKDWEEIRELLEKIQFDEATLRKAKSRLRALAKQQRLKNIRKNKTKGHDHVKHKLGKLLSRNFENDVTATSKSQKQRQKPKTLGKAPSTMATSTNKTQSISRVALNKQKMQNYNQLPGNGKGGYIKVSVFPAANEKAPSNYQSDKFHQGNARNLPQPSSMRIKGDDFAIEKPVTVIGERSRVDPVEKELVEASTNQRIREIQREKAMLAAAGLPTDEMEEQLKALTKLERRLKEHWRQKQKLLQKIHEKDQRRQAAGPSMW